MRACVPVVLCGDCRAAAANETQYFVTSLKQAVDSVRTDSLHELGVLVTSSDLEAIDPLKVSTLTVTFQEQRFTWDSYTDENGNAVQKLSQSS
jgi:hypothetical protein